MFWNDALNAGLQCLMSSWQSETTKVYFQWLHASDHNAACQWDVIELAPFIALSLNTVKARLCKRRWREHITNGCILKYVSLGKILWIHAITLKPMQQLRPQTQVAAKVAANTYEYAVCREKLCAQFMVFVRLHMFTVEHKSRTRRQQIQHRSKHSWALVSFLAK